MSYYLTAHRKGHKIALPIEDKHWYKLGVQNDTYTNASNEESNKTIKLVKPTSDPSSVDYGSTQFSSSTRGTCVYNRDNVCLLFAGSTFGLDANGPKSDDEFIGDKIYLKRITYTIGITPHIYHYKRWKVYTIDKHFHVNYDPVVSSEIDYIDVSDISPSKPFSMNLRLMLVKFTEPLTDLITSSGVTTEYGDIKNHLIMDDNTVNTNTDAVKDMLARWFNQSRIYLDASDSYQEYNQNEGDISNNFLNECYQPVFTDMLRDSCKWSGKFNVLWDEKIKWDGKPLYFNKTFNINKNVNLDEIKYRTYGQPSSDPDKSIYLPTGDTLKNTYLFIIGPGALSADLSPELYSFMDDHYGSSLPIANVSLNTKVTYYDV